MQSHRSRLTVSLLGLVLLAACAPSVTSVPGPAAVGPAAAQPELAAGATAPNPPEPVQGIATSRGPDLVATDPATVSLAAGGLQLVDVFSFT